MDRNFTRILFFAVGGLFGCLAGVCLGVTVFSGLVLEAALDEGSPAQPDYLPTLPGPASNADRDDIDQTLLPTLTPPGGGEAGSPPPDSQSPVSPLPPPTVAPVSCDCSGDVYDCPSFGSWAEAQGCFEYCIAAGVGDVHRLDDNGDGLTCEELR